MQRAVVKGVLSGDSIVVRSVVARENPAQPPAEKVFGLAYVQVPRLGSGRKVEDDEPFSVEARELMRKMVVGVVVRMEVKYSTNSGREYGRVFVEQGMVDVTKALVEKGYAKVSEQARSRISRSSGGGDAEEAENEYVKELIKIEAEAERKKEGLWNEKGRYIKREIGIEGKEEEYLKKNKGAEKEAVIEQVRDGSTLRVNLKDGYKWHLVTLQISGIKAPVVRVNIPGQTDLVEEYGEEAKAFVDLRLHQRDIKVVLEGKTAGGNGVFIGSVYHPAGNIAEVLVASGLAKVVDWTAAMVTGGPQRLREAERGAKKNKRRLWKNYDGPAEGEGTANKFEGVVTRIVSGDTIEVADAAGKEREVQLASLRQPKASEAKTAGYANEAKEYLRKKLIGQKVEVRIDYAKPATEGFRARECATVIREGRNVAALLLRRGLGHVIRHRQDDEQRSSAYDELMAAEMEGIEKKQGIHSGKEMAAKELRDSSESAARAKAVLPHLKRGGKISGVVEYVSQGSRMKIVLPKELTKITFVVAGIRCPRVTKDKDSEPFGDDALLFTRRRVMQRDVEIEIEAVDNTGAFIGMLTYNKNKNLGIELLEAGLATIHEYSADALKNSNLYYTAEKKAQAAKRGLWKTQVSNQQEQQQQQQQQQSQQQHKSQPVKVMVSEVVSADNFYVQIIKSDSTVSDLEALMQKLTITPPSATSASQKAFKQNDLVIAKFPSDDTCYRARIKKVIPSSKNLPLYECQAIDYGHCETTSIIAALPQNLNTLPPQAVEAHLSFVKSAVSDYKDDATSYLISFLNKNSVINASLDLSLPTSVYLTLFSSPTSSSLSSSFNAALLSAGYAVVDNSSPVSKRNPSAISSLSPLVDAARKARRGMWEYGDVMPDDF